MFSNLYYSLVFMYYLTIGAISHPEKHALLKQRVADIWAQ